MGNWQLAVGTWQLAPRRFVDSSLGPGGSTARTAAQLLALLLAVALLLPACGSDEPEAGATATSGAGHFPVTVRGTEIPERPMRVVSGSATHTEILYALGAGDRIVATDAFSDHPAAALDTEKFDAFNLNTEAIAAFDPDLVILAFDPGEVVSGLGALGIPTILFAPPGPADLEQVYTEWLEVGSAMGLSAEAEGLAASARAEVEDIVSRVPESEDTETYFVELDATLFSAGPGSLLGSVFGLLGLESIVPEDAGPFPQLSAEALLAADPGYYFLADVAYGESVETLAGRPGFDSLTALTESRVIELDSDIASRWGPRIVELVRVIAKEVHGI